MGVNTDFGGFQEEINACSLIHKAKQKNIDPVSKNKVDETEKKILSCETFLADVTQRFRRKCKYLKRK